MTDNLDFQRLRRDHWDLLRLVDEMASRDQAGRIHRDVRCTKMAAPHVLTVDCWPQPEES